MKRAIRKTQKTRKKSDNPAPKPEPPKFQFVAENRFIDMEPAGFTPGEIQKLQEIFNPLRNF